MNDFAGQPDAPPPAAGPLRRRRWTIFKWCRITVLLALFCGLVLGVFLNKVGLPESVKSRLVARLRAAGWEIEFSRLRLRWHRGIVLDDLHLRRARPGSGPQVFADEVECSFQRGALLHLRFEPTGAQLRGARVLWTLPGSNQPTATLAINDIDGALRFLPDDTWELTSLKAGFRGTRLSLQGTLTNASAIRDWKFPAPSRQVPTTPATLRRLLEISRQIRTIPSPILSGRFTADAANLPAGEAHLKFFAPGFASPWASATNVTLNLDVSPADGAGQFPLRLTVHATMAQTPWAGSTNIAIRASLRGDPWSNRITSVKIDLSAPHPHTRWGEAVRLRLSLTAAALEPGSLPTNGFLHLEARAAQTPWFSGSACQVEATLAPCPTNAALRGTTLHATVAQARTPWSQAGAAEITLVALHSPTNFLPASADLNLAFEDAETPWGRTGRARVEVAASLPGVSHFRLADTNLALPDRFSNFTFTASVALTNIVNPRLRLTNAVGRIEWRAPNLAAAFDTALASGRLAARADLDTVRREVRFHGDGHADPLELAPLFSTNAQRWIADFRWDPPPALSFDGRLRLPAWTNAAPDWESVVLPTIELDGRLAAGESAFQGVVVQQLSAAFSLTNETWRVAEFVLKRAEGRLSVNGEFNHRDGRLDVTLDSGIDLLEARKLVRAAKPQKLFALFQFTQPPVIRGRLSGNVRQPATLHGEAVVALTNLTFRNENIGVCTARAVYTNLFVSIFEPLVLRPGERATADGVGVDIAQELLYLTNAHGVINPYALTRAIGPQTYQAIANYQFTQPPTGRANGRIDLRGKSHRDDVHFDVDGGEFQWLGFHLSRLGGRVDWVGKTYTLTNVAGVWRGGDMRGWAYIDDGPPGGAEVMFSTAVTNVNLSDVMLDLTGKTNRLDGRVSGELNITRMVTTDWNSWHGHGHAKLQDGYLWSIPLFGLFTPMLDNIVPGLGSSKVKEATAQCTITNSVILTHSLEANAGTLRMKYDGTVDFHERLDGKVEAELLRNIPGIGILLSTALLPVSKLFIYKVGGTISDTKREPLYVIPRLLAVPFLPFKAIKEIFTPDPEKKEKKETPPEPAKY